MFFVCLVNGWNVGPDWLIVLQYFATLYVLFLMPYAFRKTRICPLEVMLSTGVLRWSRAFRLMYKKRALQMMRLYYPAALLIVVKVGLLLFFFVRWVLERFFH